MTAFDYFVILWYDHYMNMIDILKTLWTLMTVFLSAVMAIIGAIRFDADGYKYLITAIWLFLVSGVFNG